MPSEFVKSAYMINFFLKNAIYVSIAEFYADSDSVEKVAKKLRRKKLLTIKCQKIKF